MPWEAVSLHSVIQVVAIRKISTVALVVIRLLLPDPSEVTGDSDSMMS